MNRAFLGVTFLFVAAVSGGCPMYGSSTDNCAGDGCYGAQSGCPVCGPYTTCQCDPNYNCSCVAEAGVDATADCTTTGCPTGQVCALADGVVQCVSPVTAGDASPSPDSAVDAASSDADAGGAVEAAASTDASDASDAASKPRAVPCNADVTCGGSGAKCIDGLCAPATGLCSDTSQCANAGAACVDGVCIPRCSTSAPTCPDGYACDFNRDVCDITSPPCTSSASCQGGSVCVDAHCVPPCAASEAGLACASGLLCVNGGCIPDQAVTGFLCQNDGQSGQLANLCSSEQTCLHHDCFASCSMDAGAAACGTGVCKEVTVSAGTYAVCGTATTLGSECDPATGHLCASGVCIDGYCVL